MLDPCKYILYLLFLFFLNVTCQAQDFKNCKSGKKSIIVSTWNIGHFSLGKKSYSLISSLSFDEKLSDYKTFVYDSLNADILCINEYESEFCIDSVKGCPLTEDVLFGRFQSHNIFKKNKFVCNAIFSNVEVTNVRKKFFYYDIREKDIPKNINWFYYIISDLVIEDETIKLVCTHLINRASRFRQDQIAQLIDALSEYDKVIICGDMNTQNWSKFYHAGYVSANDNSITFPSKSLAIDNIFVKGLKISDVRIVKTGLSDHYPLICKITIP